MLRSARPILFGLFAFVAWIGLTYIVTAGVLSNASNEAHENAGGVLALMLFVGSLALSGAVAAWFAPASWRQNSVILGVICTSILAWFGSFKGEIWMNSLLVLCGVGLTFAGAAAVNFLLKWLKI